MGPEIGLLFRYLCPDRMSWHETVQYCPSLALYIIRDKPRNWFHWLTTFHFSIIGKSLSSSSENIFASAAVERNVVFCDSEILPYACGESEGTMVEKSETKLLSAAVQSKWRGSRPVCLAPG